MPIFDLFLFGQALATDHYIIGTGTTKIANPAIISESMA
jgi:hypothetical protein